MVVLQSSANKISKGSKYLGDDDMIPVLFLMFYLVSILTFGLKSTPAQRRNHLTVKPEKHCTISAVPDKRLAL